MILAVLYYIIYLVTLPIRLFVYLKRTPVRRLKQRASVRDYTRGRRTSEFGTYHPGHQYFDVSPNADLILPIAKEGVGSQAPLRIHDFFQQAIQRHGTAPALKWQPSQGAEFKVWTWNQYVQSSFFFEILSFLIF